MCLGTDVYMPPEAVQEEPMYTEKIDCFSFDVITLQVLSQQFPKPGNHKKKVPVSLPGLLNAMAEVSIPEIECRQNHISEINPNHTLLQVALNCLKDRIVELSSAQQLCERVAVLKEDPQYGESVRNFEVTSTAEQDRIDKRIDENQEKNEVIEEKEREVTQKWVKLVD